MQAIELVQLAAMVAIHGRVVVQSRVRFPDAALELYWTASKCRQERWARALKKLSSTTATVAQLPGAMFHPDDEWILEEVLTSEILTRIWAALSRALDRNLGTDEFTPIAASVLAGHLEARHRVLNAMLYGYGLGVEQAVALNRRRLRNERWTDMLLAFLPFPKATEYGFEHARIAEWSKALQKDKQKLGVGAVQSLALTAIASADWKVVMRPTENAELNRRIAASVIGCLPVSIFDSLGTPMSATQLALYQSEPDSHGRLNLGDQDRLRTDWFRPRGNRMDSLE